MNSAFKQWFLTSSFYEQITAEYNPELIALVGSRNMGVAREDSDYDIVIFTLQETLRYTHLPYRTKYENKTVHGYVINIINFIEMLQNTLYSVDSIYNWYFLTTMTYPENILFNTEKGQYFYDFYNNHRLDIIHLGITNVCRVMELDLMSIYHTKNYIPFDNKRFFHLIMAYSALNPGYDVVPLIKNIRWKGSVNLDEKSKEKLLEMACFLYEYCENLNLNREICTTLQMEELIWQLKQ